MLRVSLFVIVALMAGIASAQTSSDQLAASPVVYSDSPDNNQLVQNQSVDEQGNYAPDYSDDSYAYDSSAYAAPNFYLGVSALPYGYWGSAWPYYGYYGFGWPYYGFASIGFGFGWGYYGYPAYWHGGYGGGYHGWAGCPYRYPNNNWSHGNWNHDHNGSGNPTPYANSNRATPGRVATTSTPIRTNSEHATAQSASHAPMGASPNSRGSMTANTAGAAQTMHRATLPSASYYAAAHGGTAAGVAQAPHAAMTANGQAMTNRTTAMRSANGYNSANSRSTNQAYRGASVQSHGYAPAASQRNAYAAQRGYAPSHGAYPSQQRYAYAGPHYSGGHGYAPGYAHGGSAPHMSGGSSGGHYSGGGGGGHASGGAGHSH
jgi:hypothetical protein